jgi:hypothetical protein
MFAPANHTVTSLRPLRSCERSYDHFFSLRFYCLSASLRQKVDRLKLTLPTRIYQS